MQALRLVDVASSSFAAGSNAACYAGRQASTASEAQRDVCVCASFFEPRRTMMELRVLKILGSAPHPNVVRLYGFHVGLLPSQCIAGHPARCDLYVGTAAGPASSTVLWRVLERCGADLYERLPTLRRDSGAQLPEPLVLALLEQIACALAHLHQHGISHRDIKLENVLVAPCGSLKLADFDLASVDAACTDTVGTRSYAAPEVLAASERAPYAPMPADVWSFGCLAFGLATSFFFVDEASERDWRFALVARCQADGRSALRVLFSAYRLPCPFSPELCSLLDQCLQVTPAARPSSASVHNALEQLVVRNSRAALVPSAPLAQEPQAVFQLCVPPLS